MNSLCRSFALFTSLGLGLSCAVEEGAQGPTGPQGPAGPKGEPGATAGSFPDCPIGYDRDAAETQYVVCKRGIDIVVKVGSRGSAFWIDRYESSIWQQEDGSGTQYGLNSNDYPSTFPDNGQFSTPLFALSKASVKPSGFATWFQASAACRESGKRLPTGDEWISAARGTLDPGSSAGTNGACLTNGTGARNTGMGNGCTSAYGVQDMIGNLTEWTADWDAGVGPASGAAAWDATFNNDGTYNVNSGTIDNAAAAVTGFPSAITRGGTFAERDRSGIFNMNYLAAPSRRSADIGFRCVVPK